MRKAHEQDYERVKLEQRKQEVELDGQVGPERIERFGIVHRDDTRQKRVFTSVECGYKRPNDERGEEPGVKAYTLPLRWCAGLHSGLGRPKCDERFNLLFLILLLRLVPSIVLHMHLFLNVERIGWRLAKSRTSLVIIDGQDQQAETEEMKQLAEMVAAERVGVNVSVAIGMDSHEQNKRFRRNVDGNSRYATHLPEEVSWRND